MMQHVSTAMPDLFVQFFANAENRFPAWRTQGFSHSDIHNYALKHCCIYASRCDMPHVSHIATPYPANPDALSFPGHGTSLAFLHFGVLLLRPHRHRPGGFPKCHTQTSRTRRSQPWKTPACKSLFLSMKWKWRKSRSPPQGIQIFLLSRTRAARDREPAAAVSGSVRRNTDAH